MDYEADLFGDTLSNVLEFVGSRMKDSGGFGATPKLPATVEDTYHSLRIISSVAPVVQADFAKDLRNWPALHGFLSRYLDKDLELGPRGIFQLLWSMDYCGILPAKRDIFAILDANLLVNPKRENLYFALRTIMELIKPRHASELPVVLSKARISGLFSGILKKRLVDLYLDYNLGWEMIPLPEAAQWFAACQNPDGGFGFMPGTTSYIENCHYALVALVMLGVEPADRTSCKKFVMGCRTRSGGFSRNSNAAPFLDATWHAIKSLLILEGRDTFKAFPPHDLWG